MFKRLFASVLLLTAFGAFPIASTPAQALTAPSTASIAEAESPIVEVRRKGGKRFRRGFKRGKFFKRHRGFKRGRKFRRHRVHRHRLYRHRAHRRRYHRRRFRRHRFHRHRYYRYGYYRNRCHWLKVRALVTGSSYWWHRYYRCRYYYY